MACRRRCLGMPISNGAAMARTEADSFATFILGLPEDDRHGGTAHRTSTARVPALISRDIGAIEAIDELLSEVGWVVSEPVG